MKWFYTDNIHDYIFISGTEFQLNTAYDNVFRLLKALKKEKNYIDAFISIIFYKKDHEQLYKLIHNWEVEKLIDMVEEIATNILFLTNVQNDESIKYYDIELDSDLIFASFYYDYGISLIEKKGKMTWKEFLILLENLSESAPLSKQIELCKKPIDQLTSEGKDLRNARMNRLNNGNNYGKQINGLYNFLKQTANKSDNVSK